MNSVYIGIPDLEDLFVFLHHLPVDFRDNVHLLIRQVLLPVWLKALLLLEEARGNLLQRKFKSALFR